MKLYVVEQRNASGEWCVSSRGMFSDGVLTANFIFFTRHDAEHWCRKCDRVRVYVPAPKKPRRKGRK